MTMDALYADHFRTLTTRYAKLLDATPWQAIAIYAGQPLVAFQDDYEYPFKINPHYRQWVPVPDHAHSLLLIRAGTAPRLVCHQPRDYWHVVPEPPAGPWADRMDIYPVSGAGDVRGALPDDLRACALIGDAPAEVLGWGFGGVNPPELTHPLHYDRAYKTAFEVESVREANSLAARGHMAARSTFADGGSEFDIHLAYLRATGHTEAELPYNNIIALNEHGATLHYDVYDRQRPAEARALLIDAGAGHNGYAADITRTWPANDGPFAALVDDLEKAQLELIDGIRPGVSYVDLHAGMHRSIAGILRTHGIVDMDEDAMVQHNVTGTFFPHGLGHHLGLQVHDVGGKIGDRAGKALRQPGQYPFLRNLRDVEPGNVFTIEPGIYFIDQLLEELQASDAAKHVNWQKVETLRPFGGVRIEDNVWVGEDGNRNLTREAFAELAA